MNTTLAIVDDQIEHCESLIKLLKRDVPGLKIVTFTNFPDFMSSLESGTKVDVVLMDAYFGNSLLGIVYTTELLKVYPKITVVGYSGEESLGAAFKSSGAKYFVLKRLSLLEKVDRVKEILSTL